MEFEGLVAVVTGGASGIGAACVRALATGGARVGVLDLEAGPRPDPDRLPVAADVTDAAAVDAAIAAVVTEFGRLDVVVNCAGIGAVGTVEDNSDVEWA